MTEKKVKKKKPKRAAIGGQALIEGVMMRGRGATALCCRNEKGDILLDVKRRNPKIRWWQRVPIVRGTIAFFDSMVIGVKSMTKAAEVAIPEDEEEIAVVENTDKPKKEGSLKGWIILSVVLGLVLGVGLFIVLPFVLSEFVLQPFVMDRHFPVPEDGVASPMRALYLALFEGGLRLIIFLLYLILVSLLKDIRRTFQYHGAEHRVINCYEKDLPMTVDNVQKCSSRHNRCGTTFLFFVIIFSILVFSLANWLIALIGITPESVGGNIQMGFVRLGIRLALLPFVAGLSYELLKLLAMLPDNWFTTILRAPGLALQRLTTYPPDRDMAEVALKSFLAVMAMEENANLCEIDFGQFRYKDLREEVAQKLKETNADAAEVDWIFCDVTGYERNELFKLNLITLEQYKAIKRILERRATGEPLWYILGYCDFYGNRIIVNHNVLIPRFETEILCEKAIEIVGAVSDRSKETPDRLTVLDLCTGSGCIALTLAKKTSAKIVASDKSEKALSVAKNNVEGTDVEVVFSDLFDNLQGRKFDLIVSNPPYIKSDDIEGLEIEVKSYEPLEALDGGKDGLDFYRKIIASAKSYLNKGGVILFEVGQGQADEVAKMLEKDFVKVEKIKDLDGVERIVRGEVK